MLFVSCQPIEDEAYYTKEFILSMCKAAKLGGAQGLRIEGFKNIRYIKKIIDLPLIGLIKNKSKIKDRYICSTIKDIYNVLKTKCEYIAIDYTKRDNLDKDYYNKITEYIRKKSKCKIIADVSNFEESLLAFECGVDFISTALRGYTNYTKNIKLPDIEFLKKLRSKRLENIIAEGGYSTHSQYTQALKNGATIVVIGTAISRPHLITKKIITGAY